MYTATDARVANHKSQEAFNQIIYIAVGGRPGRSPNMIMGSLDLKDLRPGALAQDQNVNRAMHVGVGCLRWAELVVDG